jgi:ABC-type branched-subunit amino acid transport system ATPase component
MHQGRLIYDGLPAKLDQDETVARVYLGSSGLVEAT